MISFHLYLVFLFSLLVYPFSVYFFYIYLLYILFFNIIIHNKYKNNFHIEENFHSLIIIDNQDIFNVKRKIELPYSINYTY